MFKVVFFCKIGNFDYNLRRMVEAVSADAAVEVAMASISAADLPYVVRWEVEQG